MTKEIERIVRIVSATGAPAAVAAANRLCRRTNDGLAAVAIALALAVATLVVDRHIDLIVPSCDAETSICAEVHLIDNALEPLRESGQGGVEDKRGATIAGPRTDHLSAAVTTSL